MTDAKLNEAVAAEVFGFKEIDEGSGWWFGPGSSATLFRPIFLTGDGMLRLKAEMNRRGWFVETSTVINGCCEAYLCHEKTGRAVKRQAKDEPHAVALAALKAIRETPPADGQKGQD